MKITDTINIMDSINKPKESAIKGKIYFKNAKTGEVLFTRDNLVVNGGRSFVRDSIIEEDLEIHTDYVGYFKVGNYAIPETGLIATEPTAVNLITPLALAQNLTLTFVGSGGDLEIKPSTNANYSDDEYYVATGNAIVGKKYLDIDTSSTSDGIMYRLRITPDDLSSSKINELGLFIVRKTLSDSIVMPDTTAADVRTTMNTSTNYTFGYPASEKMFSRVTFDPVYMDGSTEFIIEYYIYF